MPLSPFLNSPEDGPWRIDVLRKTGTAFPDYLRTGVARVHKPGGPTWYEYAIGLDGYFLGPGAPDVFWHVSVDRYAPVLPSKRYTVSSDTGFDPKNPDLQQTPYTAATEYHQDGWYTIMAMPTGNGVGFGMYRIQLVDGVWKEEIWSEGGNSLPWPLGGWIRWTISYYKPLAEFTPVHPLQRQHAFDVRPG